MNDFTFKVKRNEDSILIRLPHSDFNDVLSYHFKKLIDKIIARHKCKALILDFTDVPFLDGNGLACLIYALNHCSSKSINLLTCCVNENIFNLLEQRGITKIIKIVPGVREALWLGDIYPEIKEFEDKLSRDIENFFGNPSKTNNGIENHLINKFKQMVS